MLVDYHVHPQAHGEYAYSIERMINFADTALANGISELGLADHDCYLEQIDWGIIKEVQKRYPTLAIRLGLEVDYTPVGMREKASHLSRLPLDYCLGSVHFLDGWPFDHPDYALEYAKWDTEGLYKRYYQVLKAAVSTHLFQIVAHLDLIKVFGYRPQSGGEELSNSVLLAVAKAGLAVEINTNGRYKPARELYPAPRIIQRCFDLGIPITLSSDAHEPECVGRDIALAAEAAKKVGYRQLATYHRRRLHLVSF